MNANNLYVSTCRLILQAKPDDPSTWLDLYKLIPSLRQSLSCSVCGNLLIEPYTPIESNCQHHVCRSCKGGRKKLRTSCSWCKDYSRYAENVELRTLLQCYNKLCQYITTSEIYRSLSSGTSSSNNHGSTDNTQPLLDIINEGTGFKDDFRLKKETLRAALNHISNSVKHTATQTIERTNFRNYSGKKNGETSSTYSVISTNNGNRLTIKRTAKDMSIIPLANGETEPPKPGEKINKVRKRSVYTKPPTCQCGQNGQLKGTCRGYRCPCYTADKPCTECNCISCKNPRGTQPPKPEVEVKSEATEDPSPSEVENNS